MIDWLANLEDWHWLSLALVLLALEAMGTAGFLLGAAAAAFLVTIIKLSVPGIGWQTQLITFAISSVVLSVLYWKWFKKYNTQTDHPKINQRAAQLIGRKFLLDKDVHQGSDLVQIGDTFWKVRCEHDIAAGTRVKVVSATEMMLIIAPVLESE